MNPTVATIVAALIAAFASMFGSWLIYRKESKSQIEKFAKNEQRTMDRLEAIEKKLDIHNGYAEKFGTIQVDIAEMKADIRNLRRDN